MKIPSTPKKLISKLNRKQNRAVKVLEKLLAKEGKALVRWTTGTGKTEIGVKTIQRHLNKHPGARILVLSGQTDLIGTWADRIHLYLPHADVGVFASEEKNSEAQIVISMEQSISREENLKF